VRRLRPKEQCSNLLVHRDESIALDGVVAQLAEDHVVLCAASDVVRPVQLRRPTLPGRDSIAKL
jgi:hypothetical protein